MKPEEQCVRDYLDGDDFRVSPVMREYAAWCAETANGGFDESQGARFFELHCWLVTAFDGFRAKRRMRPVLPWDPSTKIPEYLAHDAKVHTERQSDNPSEKDARCKTPTWASVVGGSDPDPLFGYLKLGQFRSLDELGRSIAYQWYNAVHMTIGGDMATFEAPVDPVCWVWFGWIRHIRRLWKSARDAELRCTPGTTRRAHDDPR